MVPKREGAAGQEKTGWGCCGLRLLSARFDLEKGHSRTPEYPSLKAILMGDPVYNKRAKVGERCGSVEEQVDCLIDHATDPNILGRTWVGWEPWV